MAATSGTPLIRHVSRRELAQSRHVWLATGGMYAIYALLTVALIMFVGGLSPLRMQVMAVLLAIVAIVHLRCEPPAIGTIANHVVLLAISAAVALAFWVYEPGGAIALGGMMFVGPLIAVRLQDRRQIAGHMGIALALAFAVAFLGGVDAAAKLAVVLMALAGAVLCFCCMLILEGAEAQGDELERLVRRDPLTGVGNRRLLDERLADELRRHERTQRQLTLVALDLNGFKAVNDQRGHSAGDDLLREVADGLVRATDERDTLVRLGGDEFVIVLPETSPRTAQRTWNAIRAELATVGITSGVGLASYPEDADEGHVLLHVADERLRENKRPPARRANDLLGAPGAPSAAPDRADVIDPRRTA